MAVTLLGLSLSSGSAFAFQCPAPAFVYKAGNGVVAGPDQPVLALADEVVSVDGEVSLNGNTSINFQGRELIAENAKYNPNTGEVRVDGHLSYQSDGIRLQSQNALIDIDDNLFSTGESSYEIDLNGKRATGEAKHMARNANGEFELDGATYSSCPPGDKSWFIRAKSLRLYPDEGIGTARNITLVFKGVPLLALPRFSFPISPKRKTGFLAPVLARGDSTGFEILIPWYWNIRPNLDATFVPRFTTKRGTQLKSELRFLNEQGYWTLDNEYLNDRQRDDDRRVFTQVRHEGSFGPFVSTNILASRVSDKEYFEDLGDSLQLASITHLEQRADLTFAQGPNTIRGRLQSYQTVDETIRLAERPYRRLPQITVHAEPQQQRLGFRAAIDAELVNFDRAESVTGTRLDLHPTLSLPITRDAWFIKPTLGYRFTHYSLRNRQADQAPRHSRNLTTFSVDSGLYFDRLLDAAGSVQTLEPRLYYLRVPFKRQSEIPVFDSSAFDFNISQLFRENRFSGGDRVADANQLSFALTSRFIDGGDGRELLRGSIGQIVYFADRRVTLGDDDIDTRSSSDMVGEISAELPNNWFAKGNMQWDPHESRTVRGSFLASYRPDSDRIINIAHRSVNTGSSAETEQLDLSALWPIRDNWRLAARWNYSLDADVSIESLLGIEYDNCCWALRFAMRRYISENGLDHDNTVYLQLVLKGLAPVGQNYGALLENTILGYRDQYE